MKVNYTQDIRDAFIRKLCNNEYRGNTIELQSVSFRVDSPVIFGSINEDYVAAELEWYDLQSRNVNDLAHIYGKRVQIWDSVSDSNFWINSNYGWCIYSEENGSQYHYVLNELWDNPDSRRAIMLYNRPSMHTDAFTDGMNDFICTTSVQYFLNDGYLEATVNMRSNDAVFGFINDYQWQRHVLEKMADDLTHHSRPVKPGPITWQAGSLHVYDRHFKLIK